MTMTTGRDVALRSKIVLCVFSCKKKKLAGPISIPSILLLVHPGAGRRRRCRRLPPRHASHEGEGAVESLAGLPVSVHGRPLDDEIVIAVLGGGGGRGEGRARE